MSYYTEMSQAIQGLAEGKRVRIRYRTEKRGDLHTATGPLARAGDMLVVKGHPVAWDLDSKMGGPYPAPLCKSVRVIE